MSPESIVTVVSLLNALGIFLLLFKMGRYTGVTDTRITKLEECVVKSMHEDEKILDQLTRHGESLARLETDSNNMKADMRSVRERQHDLANSITKATLQPVILRPLASGHEGEV